MQRSLVIATCLGLALSATASFAQVTGLEPVQVEPVAPQESAPAAENPSPSAHDATDTPSPAPSADASTPLYSPLVQFEIDRPSGTTSATVAVPVSPGGDPADEAPVVVPPQQKYPTFGSREEKMAWMRGEIVRLRAEQDFDVQQIRKAERDLETVRQELRQLKLSRRALKIQQTAAVERIHQIAETEK